MRIAVLALLAAVAAAPVLAQQAPTPALVREGVTEKLTDHVWAIPDGSAPLVPNVGIVVGSNAVLVVDTGMGARNAETILREVAKVGGSKPVYIVTTHFHPEHDMGAHAFPAGSKLIRSEDQKKDIAEFGRTLADTFASRSALNKELLDGVKHRPADISFDKEYSLDLGSVTANIFAMGANHTRGDTVVLVEGVMFSGDVAMRPQPAFASPYSTVSHWLESLGRLEAMKPAHVVPSHGPRGDVAIVQGYRTYLTKVRDAASAQKKAGKTEDEAVASVSEQLKGQYPDANRLAGAIRAAWKEAK